MFFCQSIQSCYSILPIYQKYRYTTSAIPTSVQRLINITDDGPIDRKRHVVVDPQQLIPRDLQQFQVTLGLAWLHAQVHCIPPNFLVAMVLIGSEVAAIEKHPLE